ncbi:MAG: penicillin-binding protein 2 [Nitriliruptoraceae bacterium]
MTATGPRPASSGTRIGPRAAGLAFRRIRSLVVVYGLCVLLAVGQLVNIQIVNAEEYAERGARQRERLIDLPASRGRVYDRNGEVLATSVDSVTIVANPRVFQPWESEPGTRVLPAVSIEEAAARIAPVIGRSEQHVADQLSRDSHFAYLSRQLDWEVGEAVRALGIRGIDVLTEPRREYPTGGLAAHVVGFTDIDGVGLQGLESVYDDVLRGLPGQLAVERAPSGLEIASGFRRLTEAVAGTDVVLTLDREIQHAAERAAAAAIEEHSALGASVVVLDARTFEVLAMASAPGFDPNDRQQVDVEAWRNRAVTDAFEPGSSQKAFTFAAAIEEGLVGAATRIEVPATLQVSDHEFSDLSTRSTPDLSVAEILERSSNVGTIMIAQRLGAERLHDYLRAFGYGERTGLGFPGESAGQLMPHENWWGTSLPTIAIGQGVAVTLLQFAAGYGVLANDGVALDPRLLRGTIGHDGRLVPTATTEGRRVVSADTAAEVRGMLVRAVDGEQATGTLARLPGYSVGGKTGTARKPNTDGPGYSDQYVATFAGLAPASDPRIIVAVMVDEPTPIYGGVVAAPLFREVMLAALRARGVPPDRADGTLEAAIGDAREQAVVAASQETPVVDGLEPGPVD